MQSVAALLVSMQVFSNRDNLPIRTILVPQGAEYRAVQKGCRRSQAPVSVVPLPMGSASASRLERWLTNYTLFAEAGYLLVGLGGSLVPQLQVTDVVLCQKVIAGEWADSGSEYPFDPDLTDWLRQRLTGVAEGTALGCDRIITQAQTKQSLHQRYGADVVEMESLAMARLLQAQQKRLAMLRIISDDCHHDLPDISVAIKPDGSLSPLAMTRQFLQRPLGAGRLVTGSLRALARLEATMVQLFQQS